jgi:hypothetical protein
VLCGLLALAPFISGSSVQGAEPEPAGYAGDVVLIHGFAGYWPGVGRFQDQMRQYGYRMWDYPVAIPSRVAHTIISNRSSGVMRGQLCLVGYSLGADQVITVARHLERSGVRVDRLILIEAAVPGRVPSNVAYTFNLFESRPLTDWQPFLRGVRVKSENPSSTVVNYEVNRSDPVLTRQGHLTMATSKHAQGVVIGQAVQAVAPPAVAAAPAPADTTVR